MRSSRLFYYNYAEYKMKNVNFRKAIVEDVPSIIQLLADDTLGAIREDTSSPIPQFYINAFNAINSDPNQLLTVIIENDIVIGTFQITFIPGLSRKGSTRGQIEAVRIASSHRSKGVGHLAFKWAINKCLERGCNLVQLTTDKSRPDAHRFYDDLGLIPSHIGYKKTL